jgi:two-component system sensor histidine kinase RegB
VRLRWGAALGQASFILIAQWGLGLDLPLLALFGVIAIEIVSNVVCASAMPRITVREWMLAAIMALDVLLLTLLLQLSGGSFNPFNFLYLVYLALAAVVLQPRYTWGLVALALACFASLFGGIGLQVASHVHHADQMDLHLRGMWVAFAVAAGFIVYFVGRIRRALSERDAELEHQRQRAMKSEKLASLATLAAGAAHELATPLGTIAIAAREMSDALDRGDSGSLAADSALIGEQVQRCRTILDQMSTDAGDAPGEAFQTIPLAELIRGAVETMSGSAPVEIDLDSAAADRRVSVPRRATEQALRGLIKNARDASSGDSAVVVAARSAEGEVWIEVRDRGSGMSPEVLARAGEPFFTTKEPGRGMGLGLFLAHALAERLEGRLELDSRPELGTTARFVIPAREV